MEVPEHAQAQSLRMRTGMEMACVAPTHCPSLQRGCSGVATGPTPHSQHFRVGLVQYDGFCFLSFWDHPPHLAPPLTSEPSSSHPLPPPRAFPSCWRTAVRLRF